MTANTKRLASIPHFLLLNGLVGLFIFSTVQAAKPYSIEDRIPEYFLAGTLDNQAEFNFNLSSGQSVTENITIVNNDTDVTKEYTLTAVDSEINSQQSIVFKASTSENPNLGKWIDVKEKTVIVPPKSNITIPFTISIPDGTYPGSYYGGISVTKKGQKNEANKGQSMMVSVLTRHVLGLTVNVAGTLSKDYKVENFSYDPINNNFILKINNAGNVLMAFEGQIDNQLSSPFTNTTDSVKINNFKFLPGSSVAIETKYHDLPLFGTLQSSVHGKLFYFNGVMNRYEEFGAINQELTTNLFSWPILLVGIGTIIILILIIVLGVYLSKKYLRECSEYIVQDKDTLSSIAEKYKMDWKKLAKINKIKAPYSVSTNQKILVHENKRP